MEPAPKKIKLKRDGTPSKQGEGGGRPKKYTKEFLDDLADVMLDWFAIPTNIWLMDFAIDRRITDDEFYNFAKVSEKFGRALKICKEAQKSKLVKMGCSKKFNAAMPIFVLKNIAGWRDEMGMRHSGAVKTGGFAHMDDAELIEMTARFARYVTEKAQTKK